MLELTGLKISGPAICVRPPNLERVPVALRDFDCNFCKRQGLLPQSHVVSALLFQWSTWNKRPLVCGQLINKGRNDDEGQGKFLSSFINRHLAMAFLTERRQIQLSG
jgi:hypothetical protein